MKKLQPSSQFRKDLKRFRNQPRKIEALNAVLEMLRLDIPLPPSYHAHTLSGNYKGCLECHIGPDFLLIWVDEQTGVVQLLRLGSHAELFG